MNFYKNSSEKPYSLLVIDTALASDNFSASERVFWKSIKENYDN